MGEKLAFKKSRNYVWLSIINSFVKSFSNEKKKFPVRNIFCSDVFSCVCQCANNTLFLNVEAIPGESTNAYLRDNINLTSYAHSILGCDFAVAGGGSCSSDAKDMVVTFKLDKSIVELKRRVSTGEPIKNIVLTGALASSTFRPRYKVYL